MTNFKKALYSTSIFLFFIFLIIFPNYTKNKILEVSILWYDKIIPTIPVSYFFGNLLLSYNHIFLILYKPLNKFINFENFHSFCLFIISMIVGNPSSTIIIINAYEEKLITKNELIRLISFSSFVSIFFILFVFNTKYSLPLILGQYLASIIISYSKKAERIENYSVCKVELTSLISKLPNVLLSIFSTMIFVTLIKIPISFLMKDSLYFIPTLLSIFEITTGINTLNNLYQSIPLIFFSSIILSFHGVAILLQVITLLKAKKLSINEYLKNRLIHSVFSSILSIMFFLFFELFN